MATRIVAAATASPNPPKDVHPNGAERAWLARKDKAAWVFGTIQSLSTAAGTVCAHAIGGAAPEDKDTLLVAAHGLMQQIALLCEVGQDDLGEEMPSIAPDARAWLLPPNYHAKK